MGERLLCKQEVIGSIPFTSTTGEPPCDRRSAAALKATGGGCRVRRSQTYRPGARLRAWGGGVD